MTTLTRDEALREAIAMKLMSRGDAVLSCAHALEEAMQAVDYGEDSDLRWAQERAQYVADVLKSLVGR